MIIGQLADVVLSGCGGLVFCEHCGAMFVARRSNMCANFATGRNFYRHGLLRQSSTIVGASDWCHWLQLLSAHNSAGVMKKQKKTGPRWDPAFFVGGVDGTRTRDPRRDRPVF